MTNAKLNFEVVINNKVVHINDDWTILQACEKIGLLIPRFCYSEALSIAGNCRMCLVEIEKSPKLMPACAVKTAQGMKIYTKTNLVKKTRESILEFLLINHPLDCPICDQGGECDLQDQAMIYGSDRGRFYEYKRSLEDKNKGPLIKTIMTRCIHCTRCIRFATEIAGIEMLGTTGRGKSMEVGSYIANLFNSELSGNVIDLCPVGALTSKPYAFTVRPWELKSIESIDVLDSIGSSIRIDTRGSELMRILPRTNEDVNQQWISDKARFSYDGLKSQRLNYPMIKKSLVVAQTAASATQGDRVQSRASQGKASNDSEFINQSWKQILTYLSEKLKRTGEAAWNQEKPGNPPRPQTKNPNQKQEANKRSEIKAVGVIGQFIDAETILTFKRLMNQMGVESSNIYIQNPESKWNKNINIDFRTNYLMNTRLTELEKEEIDYVLLIGSTPRYEAALLNVRLRQLVVKRNTTVASIGFPTDLTYPSNHLGNGMKTVYQLAQGKHNALYQILQAKKPIIILGFNTLQREDGDSLRFICEWIMLRLKEAREAAWPNSKTEEQGRWAQWKRSERRLHRVGCRASQGFAAMLGKPAEKPGERVDYIERTGVYSTNILHTYASTPGAFDLNVGNSGENWQNGVNFGKAMGSLPEIGAWDPLRTAQSGKQNPACVYLLGADFEMNLDATNQKPLIIYQGHHGDIGARQADIILPSSSYVEKNGLYVNTEGRVQQSQAAIKLDSAQTDIRDDWMIVQALSNIMALEWNNASHEEPQAILRTSAQSKQNDWLFHVVSASLTAMPGDTKGADATTMSKGQGGFEGSLRRCAQRINSSKNRQEGAALVASWIGLRTLAPRSGRSSRAKSSSKARGFGAHFIGTTKGLGRVRGQRPERGHARSRSEELARVLYRQAGDAPESRQAAGVESVLARAYEYYLDRNRAAVWEKSVAGEWIQNDVWLAPRFAGGGAGVSKAEGVRSLVEEPNKAPYPLFFPVKASQDRTYISNLFENIAPHLNRVNGTEFGGATADQARRTKQFILYDTSFIPLFDNFYLTDPISRASITMGKCSAQFKSHNFTF